MSGLSLHISAHGGWPHHRCGTAARSLMCYCYYYFSTARTFDTALLLRAARAAQPQQGSRGPAQQEQHHADDHHALDRPAERAHAVGRRRARRRRSGAQLRVSEEQGRDGRPAAERHHAEDAEDEPVRRQQRAAGRPAELSAKSRARLARRPCFPKAASPSVPAPSAAEAAEPTAPPAEQRGRDATADGQGRSCLCSQRRRAFKPKQATPHVR